MTILAIDATTEACSAALFYQGAYYSRYQETARGHSALLMGMIDDVMNEAGIATTALELVAFCRGPGSFTGLRIAAGVAQGIAFGLDLPVAPVSTLACIAQRAYRELGMARVLVAVDARMGEVYWGGYVLDEDELMACALAETVVAPSQVELPGGDDTWHGVGTGWDSYPEVLGGRVGSRLAGRACSLLPHARDAVDLARGIQAANQTVSAPAAQPVYLRDRVTG